jgi:hypothetical protein
MCGFTDLYFRGLKAQVLIGFMSSTPSDSVGWLAILEPSHALVSDRSYLGSKGAPGIMMASFAVLPDM